MRLFRRPPLALAACVLAGTIAAAPSTGTPSTGTPPGDVDHEVELTAEGFALHDAQEAAAVNVWTHLSLWDGNTCHSSSPDNRCERILVHALEEGEATFVLQAEVPVADYDLVVFESGPSGEAFSIAGHEQAEVFVAGEGPIPVPGPESVTIDVDADAWYLVVVFHRAAAGGWMLTGELA